VSYKIFVDNKALPNTYATLDEAKSFVETTYHQGEDYDWEQDIIVHEGENPSWTMETDEETVMIVKFED
jgi:hypothetical protein